MSKAVTALDGATATGGIAKVSEVALQGMVTLRGDLSGSKFKKAVKAVLSLDVPDKRQAHIDGVSGVAWMSPDELLVLCPYDQASDIVQRLDTALAGSHAIVVNVSDARASFRVEGAKAREVLAKLCPVDFAPQAFAPGMFRRTRMAQVPAAIWMPEADCIQIICFRSQAQYVFDLLAVAAQPGSSVDLL